MLIANHFLHILNYPLDAIDCTSFLDISLAGSAITCTRWFYPTISSFCDRPTYIFKLIAPLLAALLKLKLVLRLILPTFLAYALKFRSKVADAMKHFVLQTNPATAAVDDMAVELSFLPLPTALKKTY